MIKKLLCLQISPLGPLKGKISTYESCTNLETNSPSRGLGVNIYNNKYHP